MDCEARELAVTFFGRSDDGDGDVDGEGAVWAAWDNVPQRDEIEEGFPSSPSPRPSLTLNDGWLDAPDTNAPDASSPTDDAPERLRPRSCRGDPPAGPRVPDRLLPKVAVVGRPNVGKSSLFNRFTSSSVASDAGGEGLARLSLLSAHPRVTLISSPSSTRYLSHPPRPQAIVHDYPGVTRDRLYRRAEWNGRSFLAIDTGGIVTSADLATGLGAGGGRAAGEVRADRIPDAIEREAAVAVEEADVLVLVADGLAGPTSADEELAMWLRRKHGKKPLVLAVNKCENVAQQDMMLSPFWSMGLEPVPVSAISGTGSGDLLDAVVAGLPPLRDDAMEENPGRPTRVAIVGRPNAGKSSLLNAIVGKERAIVSELSGTTRDAVDTEFEGPDGCPWILVDTAGMRKRSSVASSSDGAERLSVHRSLNAVRRADVVILVLDGSLAGVTQQDFRLAELIEEEGRACVICVNKWDLVQKDTSTMKRFRETVLEQLRPVGNAEVVFCSAKTKRRVPAVLEAAARAADEHARRVPTATLNLVVREIVAFRQPPSVRGATRRGRVYFATQAATRPPTFVLFCNDPRLITDDYRTYVLRRLRENLGFPGTPLRVLWRGRSVSRAALERVQVRRERAGDSGF